MSLQAKPRAKWSAEELAILRVLHGTMPAAELAKLLPGRSVNSIRLKASKLKRDPTKSTTKQRPQKQLETKPRPKPKSKPKPVKVKAKPKTKRNCHRCGYARSLLPSGKKIYCMLLGKCDKEVHQ